MGMRLVLELVKFVVLRDGVIRAKVVEQKETAVTLDLYVYGGHSTDEIMRTT